MSTNYSIGDISVKSMGADSKIRQESILEKRSLAYVPAKPVTGVAYSQGGELNLDFITYAMQLPELLAMDDAEISPASVDAVCNALEDMFKKSPEAFELYHTEALIRGAEAEKILRAIDSDESAYGTSLNKANGITLANEIYKEADDLFNLAILSSQMSGPELAGAQAQVVTDRINLRRRRLGSAAMPFSEPAYVNDVIDMYKNLFAQHTFTSIEDAGITIARYLETLSYTVQGVKDLERFQKMAETLVRDFKTSSAARDAKSFYDEALAK